VLPFACKEANETLHGSTNCSWEFRFGGSRYVFVGYKDNVGVDYDYNDLIFSITGNSLQSNSAGIGSTNRS